MSTPVADKAAPQTEAPGGLDFAALIDARPIGGFQRWLFVLLGSVVVMDGFDVQVMGFVAPAIVRDWSIAPAALGPIFSAGLLGMLIGAIVLGNLADRIGRRPVLIGATLLFGAGMLASAAVAVPAQLMAARLVTGLGLGGVMGNAIALASEFSPARRRATVLMTLSCGFTAGAVAGGLVSAVLIPAAGWRAVFVVGSLVPLVLGLLMLRFLPESLPFALARGRGADVLARLAPDVDPRDVRPPTTAALRGSVADLFRAGRGLATVLLWGVAFANLLELFFLSSWLPMLAARMALGAQVPVLLGSMLQLGGIVGALAMGPLMDRRGFRGVMTAGFALATVAIALIGRDGLPLPAVVALVLAAGVGVVGGQPAINTVAAGLYPTELRATGIGWCLGVGRVGAVVGPLVAAALVARHWSNADLFLAAAAPAALACGLVWLLGRLVPRR